MADSEPTPTPAPAVPSTDARPDGFEWITKGAPDPDDLHFR